MPHDSTIDGLRDVLDGNDGGTRARLLKELQSIPTTQSVKVKPVPPPYPTRPRPTPPDPALPHPTSLYTTLTHHPSPPYTILHHPSPYYTTPKHPTPP